ncbi:pyridine nucleotide-disulfide oxidoreductase-domain-containing protein [Cadophora sp. MPI-SDFR-AT-0126]|nr:pyridine nucleotide-disulfide oxidoreductase-domain-containing protein [Leotiomycetes sp. MPI-SDFR-AT-0126]
MAETITVDYLVIGAGAMGMAFTDTLLTDTTATVAIVDRYAQPGGHWLLSYPFVRLHQPSNFYGVNSRELGENTIDRIGWNKGLSELATGDEVLAYYSKIMNRTFLPSGRVSYHPKHEYLGKGEFRSIVTNKIYRVGEKTRIVDATYLKVVVPSMRPPRYQVAEGVNLVTPNDLPKISRPYGGYTVVGAGKTGIDACLWLLANGVDPVHISWIMPRDSWYIERRSLQSGPEFAESAAASMAAFNESVMTATSAEDLFLRLQSSLQLARLDEQVLPTMFHCATVSLAELEQIRKIMKIVRQGRVVRLSADEVTLERGTYKPVPDSLYIDCTANGLAKIDPVPVFSGNQITLQSVRHCQQVFSAAFIAHVEATYGNDEVKKNELCRVIPHPDEAMDYLVVLVQTYKNGLRWNAEPQTAAWLAQSRLDLYRTMLPQVPEDPAQAAAFYQAVREQIEGICIKLEELIGQLPEKDASRAKAQLVRF